MRVGMNLVRRLLSSSQAASLSHGVMRARASIFMLHRFSMPDIGVAGHDPSILGMTLAMLRRERFDLLSLGEVFEGLLEGRRRKRPVVAFTIDDGYVDHAHIAAPVFAAFDAPVTTFVTSGFLDRSLWFWWDQIEHVFENTARRHLVADLGDARVEYRWDHSAGRSAAQADFTQRCKLAPDSVKHAAIAQLARNAEVLIPSSAPARYGPMSWDELRAAERSGMTFGPHTVTHPVLARATDDQSRFEVEASWERLSAEATQPVKIFCYPNGGRADFGVREVENLRALKFTGAVIGEPGYATPLTQGATSDACYSVPRFAYEEDLSVTRYHAGGMYRVVERLRGR